MRVLLVGSDCDLVAAVELSLSRLAEIEVVRATGDAALVEAVAAAEGRLDACIFLACDGAFLPDRHRLGEMLGASVEGRARLDLVAGLTTTRADPGPIVCACFAVGLDTLRRAIVDGRLTSLADIALALQAGTNCGSCRPELSAILAAGRTAPAPRSAAGA